MAPQTALLVNLAIVWYLVARLRRTST